MSLRQRLNDELKQAMKAADRLKVSTLRLINAAIKERDIESRTAGPDKGVGDPQILRGAEQDDQAAPRICSPPMSRPAVRIWPSRSGARSRSSAPTCPSRLGPMETKAAIDEAIAATKAASIKDMGKVIAHLKERYTGRMDFASVGPAVRAKLQG